jgi:hypothetical protein
VRSPRCDDDAGLRKAFNMNNLDTPYSLARMFLYREDQLLHSWRMALNEPVWTDDYGHLRDEDPVLGVYVNREARALPWWIMKNHHVANIDIGEVPVVVTLCEMCSSASAFRAEVGGHRLTFRLRGKYNGTLLLDDMSTRTLWSPIIGVALAGAMQGTALERLPLSQCLWREWRAMHPATLALYGEQSMRLGHGSEYSPGSPSIEAGFLHSLAQPIDERLPHNTLVLGVANRTTARAYPLESLARIGPVLNDVIGGEEIAVRCRPGTLQALAFGRRVDGRVHHFRPSASADVYDEETRSVWNEMGEAISGPLAGTQLPFFNSAIEEWYVFAAYYSHAEIFAAR